MARGNHTSVDLLLPRQAHQQASNMDEADLWLVDNSNHYLRSQLYYWASVKRAYCYKYAQVCARARDRPSPKLGAPASVAGSAKMGNRPDSL
jgi:hypothetical protein